MLSSRFALTATHSWWKWRHAIVEYSPVNLHHYFFRKRWTYQRQLSLKTIINRRTSDDLKSFQRPWNVVHEGLGWINPVPFFIDSNTNKRDTKTYIKYKKCTLTKGRQHHWCSRDAVPLPGLGGDWPDSHLCALADLPKEKCRQQRGNEPQCPAFQHLSFLLYHIFKAEQQMKEGSWIVIGTAILMVLLYTAIIFHSLR